MLRLIAFLFFIFLLISANAAEKNVVITESMMTVAELSNYERTSTLAEVVSVLDA